MTRLFLILPLLPAAVLPPLEASAQDEERLFTTFSIVCRDPETGDFGVGVTTMPTEVRAWCPFARAGVGAVCTQAMTNRGYGEKGLDLMASGKTPAEAIKAVTEADKQFAQRQVGMIDSKHEPSSFTGEKCIAWCGQIVGKNYTVQGNMLVSEKTLQECAKTFEKTTGSLAGRILAALKAGKAAGGDKRGHRSCAVIVASKRADEGKLLVDLSVDDDKEPVEAARKKFLAECSKWFQLGDRECGKGDEGGDVRELQSALKSRKLFSGDIDGKFGDDLESALKEFQKGKKISESGRVDSATLKLLRKPA